VYVIVEFTTRVVDPESVRADPASSSMLGEMVTLVALLVLHVSVTIDPGATLVALAENFSVGAADPAFFCDGLEVEVVPPQPSNTIITTTRQVTGARWKIRGSTETVLHPELARNLDSAALDFVVLPDLPNLPRAGNLSCATASPRATEGSDTPPASDRTVNCPSGTHSAGRATEAV